LQLATGVFAGVSSYTAYPGGELEGIKLTERNMLLTHAGELTPAFTETHRRKPKHSVGFFKNGMVKSVALEDVHEITTPLGEFPAELVTFYDSGELKRFFPQDGKISGLWTEEEERSLAIPLTFELPFARFTAVISGVCLYRDGSLRSLTLFPGETVEIAAPSGTVTARRGFSLYSSGALYSLEPDAPSEVPTPLGVLLAYDSNSVGINADVCSLKFDKQGRVASLVTVSHKIAVQTADGGLLTFAPRDRVNPLDGESMVTYGMTLSFDYDGDTVTIDDGDASGTFARADCGFTVLKHNASACGPADCANCSVDSDCRK
jgi:hypothetical protein